MKIKILLLFAIVCLLSSCNSKTNQPVNNVMYVENLLAVAEKNIEAEIELQGTVNHVCSHSGRRCFMIDSTGEYSIRVEATGQIESFSKEIVGSEIKLKGILKEQRLTSAEIAEWEKELIGKDLEQAENKGESCSAEMANINKMRAWMKEHGKDYYAIYYVDGLSYEVVQ